MFQKALKDVKNKEIRQVVVFNPGQGHVPVALWKLFPPKTIALVDRDLLALRYSRLNLTLNGCPPENINIFHRVGLDFESESSNDLVAGVLREEEGKDATFLTLDRAAANLSPKGTIMLSAGSTAITRLVTYVESGSRLRIKTRERWRGQSLLVLERE
ncbi:MAG: hypothetical protein A2Y90_04065 [Chloroflexi bacterium RBG_13_52_12]|nr:MAG: hypothetical protein A2Y90_04065 [Chloroflexi bacterium RBG_13_52_12]